MSDFSGILISFVHGLRCFEHLAEQSDVSEAKGDEFRNQLDASIQHLLDGNPPDIELLTEVQLSELRHFATVATQWLTDETKRVYEQRDQGKTTDGFPPMPKDLDERYQALTPQTRGAFNQLSEALAHAMPSMHRPMLMLRSALIGAIGEFEVFVASLLDQFLRVHPKAMSSELALSSKQLSRFRSIDDLLAELRERELSGVLRDGLSSWRQYINERLSLDLRTLANDWDEFGEYFQRRHLFVHRRGRVSAEYLRKVPQQLRNRLDVPPTVGTAVKLEPDYVFGALDEFEGVGTKLCFAIWRKALPEDKDACRICFHETLYQLLQERRWPVAYDVARWAFGQEDWEIDKTFCVMATSLADKHLGGVSPETAEAIRSAIREAETDDNIVRLCAIVDEADEFFKRIDAGVGLTISEHDWALDPFFRELRGDPRYRDRWSSFRTPHGAG